MSSAIGGVAFGGIQATSFCNFCKNNILLLVVVTIALFFCYGIKLFQYSIGIDTEQVIVFQAWFESHSQIGRFGFAALLRLLHFKGFNPFTASISTFCLIWLFTVSHAYILAIFSKNIGKNNAFIPFALVFITSPFWAEQFYFTMQSAEVALMILICPFIIYLLFKGFLDNEKNKVILAFLMIILMISVYQAMIPFFCCGVFICFLLLLKNSDYKPPIYRNLYLKLFVTLIGAIIVYYIIGRILIPFIFDIEKSQYLDNMNLWGKRTFKENIIRILGFIYVIVNPMILNAEIAQSVANNSKIFGNILLLPITIFFIIKVINTKQHFIYIFTGIFIPLSIMFLAIFSGNIPPMRTMYVLPLAFAFMFFFLIETCSKKISIVIVILALFTGIYQAQITAQLFYSDQLRYNEDIRLAYEIRDAVIKTSDNENLPVAIIGKYNIAEKFPVNFLQGQVMGHSFFEWGQDAREGTERSLTFMHTLGIQFDSPNDEQLEKAINGAYSMPHYPYHGYVQKLPSVIVVKF
jgi:hypothetical protein